MLWIAVYCKVGVSLLFGVEDYVDRVRAFPRLVVRGDSAADYKNWSLLPLAVGRAVRAETPRSFALVQCAVLVAGTIAVIGGVARRRPGIARGALVGFFATMLPSWLLAAGGSYDQLLAVLLLAVTLIDRPAPAALVGILLGVTHAEAATVALLGLACLSAAQIGPRLAVRLSALAGIGAARLSLMVWFHLAGQTDDRVSFVTELGIATPVGYLMDTWPVVIWSAASGGWLIIVSHVTRSCVLRRRIAVLAALTLNLAATAVTVDQSRVIMLTTMPLVVALAAYDELDGRAPDGGTPSHPRVARQALLVGMLAPLTVAWVGEIAIVGAPLRVAW